MLLRVDWTAGDRVLRKLLVPRLHVEHRTAIDDRARPRLALGIPQGQLLLQRLLSLRQKWRRQGVQGHQHQVIDRLVGSSCRPFIEKGVPILVLEALVDLASLEPLKVCAALWITPGWVLRILELDEQVTVCKLHDEIHGLHAMAESVAASVVELSHRHDVIKCDLQVAFGEGTHFMAPLRLRSTSRS